MTMRLKAVTGRAAVVGLFTIAAYFLGELKLFATAPAAVPAAAAEGKRPRVAVLVAGTLRRFLLGTTAGRMIRPMVESDGAAVDYYASLTAESFVPYRAGGYMDRLARDPVLPGNATEEATAESVREIVAGAGADPVAVLIEERIDIDGDDRLKERRGRARAAHPEEDPDLRFPIIDLSSEALKAMTTHANRNLLRLHYAMQSLWNQVLEREEGGGKYDLVMFMRDDSLWLANFSITPFLGGGPRDVFIPGCDARKPPMMASEVNDHLIISRRGSADIFGGYYSTLFDVDLDECRRNCGLDANKRGCNSEMLLKHVLERSDVNLTEVPQGWVPFQRSAVVRMPDGTTAACFHKFCQSIAEPLDLDGVDVKRCKDLRFT